jgi:hypothetical protein
MRLVNYLILCITLTSTHLFAQTDTTIWQSVSKYENNRYILTLPEKWRKVTLPDASPTEVKYDITGVGIPATVNGSPMVSHFTISRIAGNNIPKAVSEITDEYNGFSDKVLEPNVSFDSTEVAIHSGEKALYMHSRFYRRSKVSNYSKYYLVLYSPKADATFTLYMHFQYKDPMYNVERSSAFKDYAMRVFGRFLLR